MFEKIKTKVTLREAAEHLGLDVSQSGKCSCPFHNDDDPSMKLNDDYYYCFSCGASGDVIDLTAAVLKISKYRAALKLCEDFEIQCNTGKDRTEHCQDNPIQSLKALAKAMHKWKKIFAPLNDEESLDPYFVFACGNLEQAEYILETDDAEEASQFVRRFGEWYQGGYVYELQ